MRAKITREFLGTLVTAENYREILEKEGRHGLKFHSKHLKAYKQGQPSFTHGFRVNEKGDILGPMFHKVQEKINLVDTK